MERIFLLERRVKERIVKERMVIHMRVRTRKPHNLNLDRRMRILKNSNTGLLKMLQM